MRGAIRRPPWWDERAGFCQQRLPIFVAYLCYIQPSSNISYILSLLEPLSFLSPDSRTFRRADPKMRVLLLFGVIFFDLFAIQNVVRKMLRKNIEKSAKIDDFGPPNLPPNPAKIESKSMFQKLHDFWKHFWQNISKLKASKPWNYQFYLGKITIFMVLAKRVFLQFACIFGPKNLPKTLPKRGPNH